ncbi:hypothetical protein GTZ97_12030 [Aquabacterium fontiphilum]|uniref:Mth938-like domain-containing protein n=1 Tax=Aquabacterium fontiphilum TaxID=450365 RepID=UPI00137746E5|nr:Mth938-like domain-containing protein [Aquabacterium fontiphilum]NBD21392.1 hypothetical protein [Aquabacterium fontiphilum]
MKLQPDRAEGVNVIHAYTADSISVNGTAHPHAVLVPHTGEVLPWDAASWEALTEVHFAHIAQARPELVVFGSGARLRFVKPALLRPLIEARIGIETMDSAAACRTFNFLVGEGRRVMGAILLPRV